ncbi:nickel-binding protein [Halomonas campaniensis]|uniref:nickel-binding protein n=1 Tax=Halomonas campaniensis TaxID=213554 RepID=UPI0035621A10
MIDLFLERQLPTPVTPDLVRQLTLEVGACLDLHRVQWQGSLLARDGHRLVCHFRARDTESARIGLRQAGAEVERLWAGTLHDAPGEDPLATNVLVERTFPAPVTLAAIQAIEDAGAACLQNHRVCFVRTCFALDRRRMLCLYRSPDAESVRLAQRLAGMPLERVWAFRHVRPLPENSTAAR